jgi:hypothetical protein
MNEGTEEGGVPAAKRRVAESPKRRKERSGKRGERKAAEMNGTRSIAERGEN